MEASCIICPTYLGSSCDGPVPHAAGLWHYSISACALHWSSCESLRKLCTNRCMAYVSLPSTTLPKQPAGCGLRDYEFPRDKGSGLVAVSKMTPLFRVFLGFLLTVLFTEECCGHTGTVVTCIVEYQIIVFTSILSCSISVGASFL